MLTITVIISPPQDMCRLLLSNSCNVEDKNLSEVSPLAINFTKDNLKIILILPTY
jgi:ankyrin repeat protein